MAVDWLAVATVAAAAAALALLYKLFVAPVVPAGSNYLTMPGPPQWFGRYFGNPPPPDLFRFELHHLFLAYIPVYGDLVRRRIFSRDVVVVLSPVLLSQILKDKEHFPNRSQTGIRDLLPLGLLGLDSNAMWQHHRRTLLPMFADRFLRQYGEVFVSVTNLFCEKFVDEAARQGKSLEIHQGLSRVALDALGYTGFGANFGALENSEAPYLTASTAMVQAALLLTAIPLSIAKVVQNGMWRAAQKGLKVFETSISSIGAAAQPDRSGRLHMLAEFKTSDLSYEEIRDELVTLVVAGHETTANAMSWLLYELSQNPTAQARVREEIDQLFATPGFDINRIYDLRARLPLLRSAIMEGLRLYPPVPVVPRECAKATTIAGYQIHEGARMYCSTYACFRNPNYFERANEFVVDRFLGVGDPDADPDNHTSDLARLVLPFGSGLRVCIGQRFALLEETVVLCILLARYEVSLDKDHPVSSISHITLTPKRGIKLFFKRRADGPFAH